MVCNIVEEPAYVGAISRESMKTFGLGKKPHTLGLLAMVLRQRRLE